MRILRLIFLASIAMFLCATDIEHIAEDGEPNHSDRRYGLELYVYQLTSLLDMQIDEIAEMIPEQEVEKLRSDHYTWKIERDIQCAKVGRTEPGELRELECLAELSEVYFERHEIEIGNLEIQRKKKDDPKQEVTPNNVLQPIP